MVYNRCGKSGLKLSAVSLLVCRLNSVLMTILPIFRKTWYTAFDLGITHFDLANNYGNLGSSAEENFGIILKRGMGAYRDELASLQRLAMICGQVHTGIKTAQGNT